MKMKAHESDIDGGANQIQKFGDTSSKTNEISLPCKEKKAQYIFCGVSNPIPDILMGLS